MDLISRVVLLLQLEEVVVVEEEEVEEVEEVFHLQLLNVKIGPGHLLTLLAVKWTAA
jgi:hypothetical protein